MNIKYEFKRHVHLFPHKDTPTRQTVLPGSALWVFCVSMAGAQGSIYDRPARCRDPAPAAWSPEPPALLTPPEAPSQSACFKLVD